MAASKQPATAMLPIVRRPECPATAIISVGNKLASPPRSQIVDGMTTLIPPATNTLRKEPIGFTDRLAFLVNAYRTRLMPQCIQGRSRSPCRCDYAETPQLDAIAHRNRELPTLAGG
jgi:hypothetical protein